MRFTTTTKQTPHDYKFNSMIAGFAALLARADGAMVRQMRKNCYAPK
jgi:hypothetical protein